MNCVAYPSCSFNPALGAMSGKSFSEIGAANSGTFASGNGCDFGLASLVTVGFPVLPWFTGACATPASIIASAAAPNLNPIVLAHKLNRPTPHARLVRSRSLTHLSLSRYAQQPRYAQSDHPVPCCGTHLRRSLVNEVSYKTFGERNRKPPPTLISLRSFVPLIINLHILEAMRRGYAETRSQFPGSVATSAACAEPHGPLCIALYVFRRSIALLWNHNQRPSFAS